VILLLLLSVCPHV